MRVQNNIFILLITFLLSVNPAFATEKPVPPEPHVYTFHTALQSPIKEILCTRIKEAFRRLGLKAEIQINPSSQRALILANTEGDGDAARVPHIKTIAPDNTTNLILVSEPIINLPLTVYTKDLSFPVTGWDSLQKYHNGARIGAKILEKNIPGKRTFLPTTAQLVQMLDSGRIDTMVEWSLVADHTIKNLGVQVQKLSPPILTQPLHLYLHKEHQSLVPQLNKVLTQMKEEGFFYNQPSEFIFYTGIKSPEKEVIEQRLAEAFRRAGNFKFTLILPKSSQRALVLANEDGDGDAGRVRNIQKLAPANTNNLILVPESINTLNLYVYSNGAISEVDGYESLTPLHNGFRRGIKILEKNMLGKRITLPETPRLLQMLNDGRIDTVVEWPAIADKLLKENHYPNIVKLPNPLISMPIYPHIQRRHQLLIPKLVQALQDMKQDGSFAKIAEDVKKQAQPQ